MNMRYACYDSKRIEPKPGAVGQCQICGNQVKAYCGKINVWHWRHKNLPDCDSFYEPMSKWHKNWQNQFPEEWREVVLERKGVKHFADIFTLNGLVIEFQHSSISPEKIKEREDFYIKMIWVVDAIDFKKNMKIRDIYNEQISKLKRKFSRRLLTEQISQEIDSEINYIILEINQLEGQRIRDPRTLKSKKNTLSIYKKLLKNLDEYLLYEAFPIWLRNGRVLYEYSDNLDMNEVEIRKQIINLQLQGNTPQEKLEILINETQEKNSNKKKLLQEIYKEVKCIFLEGLPSLIEMKMLEIEKIKLALPKIDEEINSRKLDLESLKETKDSRVSDFLAEKTLEYNLEIKKIKDEYSDLFSYEWKYERRSWNSASRPIFLDMGDDYLFEMKPNSLLKRISKTHFISNYSDKDLLNRY